MSAAETATANGALAALMIALAGRDQATEDHSRRVAFIAGRIMGALLRNRHSLAGFPLCRDCKTEIQRIRVAGLVHDVGKIGVPDHILSKSGPLTDEEWVYMRQHPILSEAIVRSIPGFDAELLATIRGHHEAWNGEGYPDRLIGEQIPIGARILAVADSFDAMVTDRPYRRGMAELDAVFTLKAGAGRFWDPKVVTAFLELWQAGAIL